MPAQQQQQQQQHGSMRQHDTSATGPSSNFSSCSPECNATAVGISSADCLKHQHHELGMSSVTWVHCWTLALCPEPWNLHPAPLLLHPAVRLHSNSPAGEPLPMVTYTESRAFHDPSAVLCQHRATTTGTDPCLVHNIYSDAASVKCRLCSARLASWATGS
jgi:hypothetical protein